MTKAYRDSVRKFHDLGRDGRIILKRDMRKLMRAVVNWISLAHEGPVEGSCGHSKENSGIIKDEIFPGATNVSRRILFDGIN
jgi:hypothetical protein